MIKGEGIIYIIKIMLNIFVTSPLDQFEIKTFWGFITPFFNLNIINITNFALYSLIVLIIILSIWLLTNNNNKIIGSKSFLINEIIYDTILGITKSQIGGKSWGYFFPLIYTFFMFIFTANLISIVPYSFALTSQIVFVISLSFIIWGGVTILGLYKHKLVFFSLFVPLGTPLPLVPLLALIELLSYSARAISLGLRLTANVISGHLLIIILGGLLFTFISLSFITFVIGLIPLAAVYAILILEFAISIIQAYVWSILTCNYLKDAIYLH